MSLGVYVHIPFCATRCDYCDFATWTDREALIDDYVEACRADVVRWRDRAILDRASSVFFGGGTPSLLPADRLLSILAEIPLAAGAEVTVECNPDSADVAKLAAYRQGGVTRCSFGVQSMQPHVLAALNRTHDPENVARAVRAARSAGFETFNLDLIYGTPGESVAEWRDTLDRVLDLEPPHLSAYALTIEAGTALGERVASGAPAPDDDDQAEKYEVADERLQRAGLDWYEVSNWARPGHECRHNLLHWSCGDYLPIGCAAHGHRDGRRWWNVRTPDRYLAQVRAGDDPTGGSEDLDEHQRREERFALALRTAAGAELPGVQDAVTSGPAAARLRHECALLTDAGLLDVDGRRVVLTRRGRLLATEITARLLLAAGGPGASRPAPPSGVSVASSSPAWHSVPLSARP
ncbi:MAG: radical SAM family heme chaperone HemW [Acidimicrobiia bacterium]